ncbi:MAG: C4-dicarboxylate TRAP transporter substrate-binding protein [Peptococcaceae bacterium]|jgi:tripartite ATP-independent transporter DctP family solute receptor|nr:C4-dicarboxylate TRAP transporter substrate-binding protein [Peptococcaceae bacterium]MDH7524399.1 C4-dicarboxylate TRAP transporter substrate-binding protein [Peptococcaceae bacterium]
MVKKIISIILTAALMVVLLPGCSQQGGSGQQAEQKQEAKKYVLKLSTQLAATDPLVDGFRLLKKNVEAKTGGNLVIEIFPSAQLGSDEDVIEQTRQGVNVAVLTDGGRMANFVKDIGIIGMPYLVDNYDDIVKLVTSSTFKKWENELEKNCGIKVLSFNWYHGPRHFLTNKPVKTPEDLRGVRIRTPGAPVWQESIKAMGATPVALGWTEVYPAMQQKVIDGAEAQHLASYGARVYEVIKYIDKTAHFHLINGIIVGTKWFNTLPKEYQDILLSETKEAAKQTALNVIKVADDYEKKMVAAGMVVVEPNIPAFKAAAEKAYDVLGFKELRTQILKEIGK